MDAAVRGTRTNAPSGASRTVRGGRRLIAVLAAVITLVASGCTLFGWGYNGNGELATAANTTGSRVPIAAAPWKRIAGGEYHTCGLRADDTLWCWGRNNYGQLGNGTVGTDINSSPSPARSVRQP